MDDIQELLQASDCGVSEPAAQESMGVAEPAAQQSIDVSEPAAQKSTMDEPAAQAV